MSDLTNIMSNVIKEAMYSILPDVIKDIRKQERIRMESELNIMSNTLYTKKDLARHFQVSERSVEHWHDILRAGGYPPIQIGGNVRYSKEHIQYLESLHI